MNTFRLVACFQHDIPAGLNFMTFAPGLLTKSYFQFTLLYQKYYGQHTHKNKIRLHIFCIYISYLLHISFAYIYHLLPMDLWVTLLGGSGQENTVRSTHTKYRTATKEYVPTTPIFYTNKIKTVIHIPSCLSLRYGTLRYDTSSICSATGSQKVFLAS